MESLNSSSFLKMGNVSLMEYKELIKTPEFWLETIQNELYTEVNNFMIKNNLNQTQLAEQLGVSKGYISQILNGRFNYTLKKLIELSLAIGQVPSLEFKSVNEFVKSKEGIKKHNMPTKVIRRTKKIAMK